LPDLAGIPVFITAGENDPIFPAKESEDLEELLAGAGAVTEVHWEMNGHSLTRTEVDSAAEWYETTFVK